MVVRVINNESIEVIHKTSDRGVLQETKRYRPEDIAVLVYWSIYTGYDAVERAKYLAHEKYNLVISNCEHFVFKARTGEKESKQVQAAAKGGLAGGGAGALAAGGAGVSIGAFIGGAIGSIVPVAGTTFGAFVGSFIGGGIGVAVGTGGGAAGGGFLNLIRINKKRR